MSATALVAAGSGIAAGFLLFSPRPEAIASPEIIAAAQRSSTWGADPIWLATSSEQARFRRVRDRAYAYCFRDGAITRTCVDEQDDAIQGGVLSLMMAADLRRRRDRNRLATRERWIAENLDVEVRARAYCWSVYYDHGGQDARILGACLGNLGTFQPIIQMPVRD
jgi:hypothetical protein